MRECIDLVRQCKIVLLGNHDQGAMFDPDGFNPAERAIFWTALESPAESRQSKEELLGVPRRAAAVHKENGLLYARLEARNPLNEYVFPEDIYNRRKMDRIFALVEKYCFQGHTHVPGVFTENPQDDLYQFHSPEDLNYEFKFDARKALVNVGSVGQPRRRRARLLRAPGRRGPLRRRVEYDIEVTIQKIHAIPELDNFLGDRLRDGR